jgi:recombination associated protein RdgC
MEFRNVRLPKTAASEEDAANRKEEMEGMILERLYLFEEIIRIMNDLFRIFLQIRIGSNWRDEVLKIRNWVSKSVASM